jgi:urease accessory protein UreF
MKSLLQQLYSGSISPADQYVPKTEEYRKMRQEHFHHYESFIKILEKLEPPQHERFIEIMDEQLDTAPLEFSAMFINGFRLGARMMIEVYQHDFPDEQE